MDALAPDYKALSLLSPEQVRKFRAVPLLAENGHLTLLAESKNPRSRKALQMILGKELRFEETSKEALDKLIFKHYPQT